MMERIINEFRVIETDDGFRIEIKGDKEKIKAFMSGFGWHKPWPHWHPGRWGAHWRPHEFPFGPWIKMASCWGPWDSETDESEDVSEA